MSVVNKRELLNDIVNFYQDSFRKNKKAQEYMESLGIYDNQIYERFKLGYADGSLLKAIPTKGEVKDNLKQMGILTDENKEYFLDCVVFSIFNQDDDCVGLAGKRLTDDKELPFSNGSACIFNWQAFKNKEIIFTETIIEALKICQLGYDNVIPLFQGLNEGHLEFLTKYRHSKIYLALDKEGIITQLSKLDFSCYSIRLKDDLTTETLEKAVSEAEPIATTIGEGILFLTSDNTNNTSVYTYRKRNTKKTT